MSRSEREAVDRRWLYLRHLNELRQLLFGDEPTTTSGLVHGEDSRLRCASILNQLQADLGIPSGCMPTDLADPAAEKEPGEAQSATHGQRELQTQGAVLSGQSDSPTEATWR